MRKFIIISFFIINSCSYPEIIRDELIYENDFEEEVLENIDGGGISIFNNTKVIGNFNNDGFTIHLENVGDHEYVFISFDLYIHGSWDGNFNGFSENDKPDKWILEYKPEMDLFKDPEFDKFETTFSNSPVGQTIVLDNPIQKHFHMKIIQKLVLLKLILMISAQTVFLVDQLHL